MKESYYKENYYENIVWDESVKIFEDNIDCIYYVVGLGKLIARTTTRYAAEAVKRLMEL